MAQSIIIYAALATPVNAAFATAGTGGTLAAATYYYRVSATDSAGTETLASAETSIVTTGATSTATVNWGAVTGAAGYKVYGRTTGAELLIATVGAVTTYTDTGAITPSGALPTANNTGIAGTTSTDVVVAAGVTVTLGLYVATGSVVPGMRATIYAATPGADLRLTDLDHVNKQAQLVGPNTYRVVRRAAGSSFGVYSGT